MKRRQFHQAALTLALIFSSSASALAADAYPTQAITLVVPFSVGGSTDVVARLLGQQLSQSLGKPVVVENKVGGGGAIGWGNVARSKADGHTLLTTETSLSIAAGLLPNLPFDPRTAFEHVTIAASVPHVILVNPTLPVENVEQLLSWVQQQPNAVFYGSGGVGTNTHLAGELFNSLTGANLTHVPYRGASAVLTDLMSNQVQVMISSIPTALPHIQSGKLRALMVTDTERSPALPDVPSAPEAGLPDMTMRFWIGLAAPADTPDTVLDQLNQTSVEVLQNPATRKILQDQGLEVVGNSRAEATAAIEAEMNRWSALIQSAGITAN